MGWNYINTNRKDIYFLIGKFLKEDAEKLRNKLDVAWNIQEEHPLLKHVWEARKGIVEAMKMLSTFEGKELDKEKVRIG